MLHRRALLISLLLGFALVLVVPSLAQDAEFDVYVDGLVNPRGLSFDADGNLWIAEAGNGGPYLTENDTPYGASSQITMVSPEGEKSVVIAGLNSYRQGNSLGAHAVLSTGDSLWVLLGESSDFRIPFTTALMELDPATGRVKTFIDLLTPELELDPDGNPNQEVNPVDFEVAPDGTIYIAAAGCNCIMSWTADAGVEIAASWLFEGDNPVPTSVETDAEGNLYVGFLTGFPWPEGAARIEKWSGGELVETFSGLTAVVGLLVTDDGTIYATELGVFTQGSGFSPGRVVMVSADGITPLLEGLPSPYGLAMNAAGELYVATGAIGGQDGAVVRVPVGM